MNNDPIAADGPLTQSEARPSLAWAGAEALVPKLAAALVAITALLAAVMQPAAASQPGPAQGAPATVASPR